MASSTPSPVPAKPGTSQPWQPPPPAQQTALPPAPVTLRTGHFVVFGVLLFALGLVSGLWWSEYTRNNALEQALTAQPKLVPGNGDEVSSPEEGQSVEDMLALTVLQDAVYRNNQLAESGPATEQSAAEPDDDAAEAGPSVVWSAPGIPPDTISWDETNSYATGSGQNTYQQEVNYPVQLLVPPPAYNQYPPDQFYNPYNPYYPYYSPPYILFGNSGHRFNSFSRRGTATTDGFRFGRS